MCVLRWAGSNVLRSRSESRACSYKDTLGRSRWRSVTFGTHQACPRSLCLRRIETKRSWIQLLVVSVQGPVSPRRRFETHPTPFPCTSQWVRGCGYAERLQLTIGKREVCWRKRRSRPKSPLSFRAAVLDPVSIPPLQGPPRRPVGRLFSAHTNPTTQQPLKKDQVQIHPSGQLVARCILSTLQYLQNPKGAPECL